MTSGPLLSGIDPRLSTLLFLLASLPRPAHAARFEYRSFQPYGAQEAIAAGPAAAGGLEISRVAGRHAARGLWTWRPERTETPFSAVRLDAEVIVPAGCGLSWELRAVLAGNGRPTAWQTIVPGVPLQLAAPADAAQLRANLTSCSPDTTPRVMRVTLSCYDVVEMTTAQLGRAPVLGASAPQGPGRLEPPDIPGARLTVEPPPIVARQVWSGLSPRQAYEPLGPGKLTVHHTSEPRASRWHGPGTIRGIQDFHILERGWNDIAYHFLIAPDGTVYRGRPEAANGSHSVPNRHKLGVCVVGNFNRGEERISSPARASLVRLLAYLAGKYGISSRAIYGHRDFNNTDCPGETLYGALDELRSEVERLLREASSLREHEATRARVVPSNVRPALRSSS